jgi:glycosyltransferase involved in cell wall biosynthesis
LTRLLFVMPSLTALGGGLERYCRDVVEAAALARPQAELVAVLAREPRLMRPELLDAAVRARLRVTGAHGEARLRRGGELVARALAEAARRPSLVVCGHVHYAALCRLMASMSRAPVISLLDTARCRPGAPTAAVAAKLAHLPPPRLLTVARLDADERYKGVDLVLRALALLPRRPSYLVVGDGSDRERLRQIAAGLGVDVELYGHAADGELVDLYRACDLYVMPSRNEGFGYVFIEALACGVPVIAGSVDGSVDALAGGRLGTLVNPLDPDAIAEAIAAQLAAPRPSPTALHAEVEARFGVAAFRRRLAAALARVN